MSNNATPQTNPKAEIIRSTLQRFNISVQMRDIRSGPTVTQYTFHPANTVKLYNIKALENELILALKTTNITLHLPVPGTDYCSVEVNNDSVDSVSFISSLPALKRAKDPLTVILGKDLENKMRTLSLSTCPHLIVAGTTGSGKSVWLHAMILSLILTYNPAQLQLLLIDPKSVELTLYEDIPHLLKPVATDFSAAINILEFLLKKMTERYQIIRKYKLQNITDYNIFAKATGFSPLPYTVLVIDEFADLILTDRKTIEPLVCRLTAMARAVGIHIVIGTQRPDATVLTGLIKGNIPTCIAFRTANPVNSRVILDEGGAEKLLGKGDGLLKSPESRRPIRFKGAFVSDKFIKSVASKWSNSSNLSNMERDD